MHKPVLIIIDLLNDFLDQWPAGSRRRLLDATQQLVGIIRSKDCPRVRQEFEPDLQDAFPEMRDKGIRLTIKGTAGSQLVPELTVVAGDRVILKKRYSAFFRTDLDEILATLQPDVLILAGVNTHACIRTTAIDAYQRDWRVVLAVDCIDSYDKEHHEISLRYMKDKIASIMTNEEIARKLQS